MINNFPKKLACTTKYNLVHLTGKMVKIKSTIQHQYQPYQVNVIMVIMVIKYSESSYIQIQKQNKMVYIIKCMWYLYTKTQQRKRDRDLATIYSRIPLVSHSDDDRTLPLPWLRYSLGGSSEWCTVISVTMVTWWMWGGRKMVVQPT